MQSTQSTFNIISNQDATIGGKLVSFNRLLQNAVDELDEGIKLVVEDEFTSRRKDAGMSPLYKKATISTHYTSTRT